MGSTVSVPVPKRTMWGTGIREIDDAVGGFRYGRVYGFSGETGAGATIMCTQLLVNAARHGDKGAIILTSESKDEYLSNVGKLDFGFEEYRKASKSIFEEYYKKGMIEVIQASERLYALKSAAESDPHNVLAYVKKLSSEINDILINSNVSVLVIDRATAFFVRDDYESGTMLLNSIGDRGVKDPKRIIFATAEAGKLEYVSVSGLIELGLPDKTRIRHATVRHMDGSHASQFQYIITDHGISHTQSDEKDVGLLLRHV